MKPLKSEIQHIGISVRDLDRSVAWYSGFFGFVETKRFKKDELEISGAILQLGNMTLEVLAPFKPVSPSPPPASLVEQLRKTGVNHIALSVSDITSCFEKLSASGSAMMTPLIEGRFFFCADPDGTALEIRKA